MATNDVVLGAAMRSNLLSLQNTQRTIDATQLRLATGKKVNSALDNPQSFFQAQSLNNRASDLTRLLDGIGQSIRTIEEADKGITALTSLVEQASSIASEAQAEIAASEGFVSLTGTKDLRGINLTTGSNGSIAAGEVFRISFQDVDINGGNALNTDITIAADDTVYDLVARINDPVLATAPTAPYIKASVDDQGRLKLTSVQDGGLIRITDVAAATSIDADGIAFLGLDASVGTENNIAVTRLGGTVISGRTLVGQAATAGSAVNGVFEASDNLFSAVAANNAGFLNSLTAAADINLTIDGTSTTVGNVTGAQTVQDVLDAINNAGISDKVVASFNTRTGRLELDFADTVGQVELTFTATAAATTISFGFGTQAADQALPAIGNAASEIFRFSGSSANLEQYSKDFNKIRGQIDDLVEDANYRGVNLLGGDDLVTTFNENRTNKLTTTGKDFSALGLGLSVADFVDAGKITKSISEVQNALTSVRAFGASIANDLAIIQTRRDFTEQTINTLKAGASDLTDADLNEEGANLLALQTAQQLGVTSLSLASQSQQSVLRLF